MKKIFILLCIVTSLLWADNIGFRNIDFGLNSIQVQSKLNISKINFEIKSQGLEKNIIIPEINENGEVFFGQLIFKKNVFNSYVLVTKKVKTLDESDKIIEVMLKYWTKQYGIPTKIINQKIDENWISQNKNLREIPIAEWNRIGYFLGKILLIPQEEGFLVSLSLTKY